MGQLILWLGRGLLIGGGAIVSFFSGQVAEKGADALSNVVDVRDSKGGYKPWYIVLIFVMMGAGVYFLTRLFTGKKKLLALALLCMAMDFASGGPSIEVVAASVLFSVAAASSAQNSLQYCPEFITFNIDTVPSAFQIEVVGVGVIFNMNATGITNMNGIRAVGALPTGQYIFQIANGYVSKNTTFTVTNADADTVLSVSGFSTKPGNAFIRYNQATAFANTQFMLPPFLYAAFPSAAAADQFTITWNNAKRTIQTVARLELVSFLAYKQQVVDTRYNLDNYQREIESVQFLGAAEQTVYYQDVISA